jgi:hypothetical protein
MPAPAEPEPEPAPEISVPHLVFGPFPAGIALHAERRGPEAVYAGLLGGLLLGVLVALLRELLSRRFADAAEAARMVGLPVLAVLPPTMRNPSGRRPRR